MGMDFFSFKLCRQQRPDEYMDWATYMAWAIKGYSLNH